MKKFSIYNVALVVFFAFLVSCLVSLVTPIARAATLGVVVNNATPELGQPIRVDVPLDTQGDDANAIQAQVIFPANRFILESVDDGASPVSFWIEQPTEIASGVVEFSGIMPGGFEGAASSVVSLWLLPKSSGAGVVSLGNVTLLRNDGQATPITVSSIAATVMVSSAVASSAPNVPVSPILPTPFKPVVSRDPSVYNGKYFLVFSTTDKGSGIDYYEVMEVPSGSATTSASAWTIATSPYLLKDQTLSSDIYVRAVDNNGNSIVVEVPAAYPPFFARNGLGIWLILGVLSLIILFGLIGFLRPRRAV